MLSFSESFSKASALIARSANLDFLLDWIVDLVLRFVDLGVSLGVGCWEVCCWIISGITDVEEEGRSLSNLSSIVCVIGKVEGLSWVSCIFVSKDCWIYDLSV